MNDQPWLERLLKVRPSERRLVGLVAVVFAGTQSTHALSVNAADTLFFSRFGVDNLPAMFMILGVVSALALAAYTAALGSLPRDAFYPGLLVAGALVMVVLRLSVFIDARWVYAVIWVTTNMLLLVTLTFMWNVAGDVVDTRSGKRLFPVFASAGVLGGFLGNVMTGPLTSVIGAPNLLVVIAGLLVATAFVVRRVALGIDIVPRRVRPLTEIKRSLELGMSSPLLRLAAAGLILGSALFSLVVFPFSVEVAAAFETEAEIASYLGLFSAAATAATFVVALFVANRLFARFGVVTAWFVVTVVYVGGFAVLLASLTLVTASVFRFLQWIGVNAISGTARTALFNVIGSEDRGAVIAAYAAVPAQIGVAAAGALLMVSRQIGPRSSTAIALVLALVLSAVVWRMRRLYSGALLDALQQGQVATFAGSAPGALSAGVTAEAVAVATAGLTDASAQVRRLSVAMLGRMEATDTAPLVTEMLQDRDLEVRLAALDSLGRFSSALDSQIARLSPGDVLSALFPEGLAGGLDEAPVHARGKTVEWLLKVGEHQAATDALTALIDSEDPESRQVGWDAVAAAGWAPDRSDVALALRADPSNTVRMTAAFAAAATIGPGPELHEALTDPVPRVRQAAASAWTSAGGGPDEPMAILNEGPPWAWEAAVTALSGSAIDVRDWIYHWAEPKVADLARLAGQTAAIERSLTDGASMPATAYLHWLVHERMQSSRRVAVRILAFLEEPTAVQNIIDGLASANNEARAQALEAAETIGGALGRITVPVLEAAAIPAYRTHDVLRELAGDDDPWLRLLVLRTVIELAASEWAEIIEPATKDINPAVRSTAREIATRLETEMTDTLETIGLVDRMLLLRSIRLFESLLPADLERLATIAVEKRFAAGERVFKRGDASSDTLIIVSGTIEYLTEDAQTLSRLGPRQHLGELTALSGTPRPADAFALTQVSALSIDQTSLNNLILEHPEVARQMLSSLAAQFADAIADITPRDQHK